MDFIFSVYNHLGPVDLIFSVYNHLGPMDFNILIPSNYNGYVFNPQNNVKIK